MIGRFRFIPRRSLVLKVAILVCAVWLTVAFLLSAEQRAAAPHSHQHDAAFAPEALLGGAPKVRPPLLHCTYEMLKFDYRIVAKILIF